MLAKVTSAAVIGLDAVPITVEVDIAAQGLPSFTIVGLPDKAVEESKERVRAPDTNSYDPLLGEENGRAAKGNTYCPLKFALADPV